MAVRERGMPALARMDNSVRRGFFHDLSIGAYFCDTLGMLKVARINAGPDFADLHRHLGGAVHPKVLFGYLVQEGADVGASELERDTIQRLLERFPTYRD